MTSKINWKSLKTVNGYPADEVISALQKEIRRSEVDNAVFWAYELCVSGPDFEKKFWERMRTITVEDIGFGNPQASVVIQALEKAYFYEYENPNDSLIQALFAAAYLANSKKDRYIDEYKNFLKANTEKKNIPDYALDKHTKRGKELGRGVEHFWTEAAKIFPELKNRNKKYLKIILKKLS
jgi:replication-associated recombination protein RarA